MKSILLVDDSLFVRTTLKNILVQNGYNIAGEAVDGYDAIEKYENCTPDMVVMDITMHFMNGAEASKEILKLHPDAKIVILSALGKQEDIINLLKMGVKDYIVKPFNQEKLLATVDFQFSH